MKISLVFIPEKKKTTTQCHKFYWQVESQWSLSLKLPNQWHHCFCITVYSAIDFIIALESDVSENWIRYFAQSHTAITTPPPPLPRYPFDVHILGDVEGFRIFQWMTFHAVWCFFALLSCHRFRAFLVKSFQFPNNALMARYESNGIIKYFDVWKIHDSSNIIQTAAAANEYLMLMAQIWKRLSKHSSHSNLLELARRLKIC